MGSHLRLKWHPRGTHGPPGLLWGGFGSKPSGATAAFLAGAFWFHPANIFLGWIWLQALQGNCGVPCRGIAFTQKTIFLVCWSKDPSRATAALLAVAFFTTKKLDYLAQTVVLRIADSVLPACGPQTSKLQTTWMAGPGNPGFRGIQGFQGKGLLSVPRLPRVPRVPRDPRDPRVPKAPGVAR